MYLRVDNIFDGNSPIINYHGLNTSLFERNVYFNNDTSLAVFYKGETFEENENITVISEEEYENFKVQKENEKPKEDITIDIEERFSNLEQTLNLLLVGEI